MNTMNTKGTTFFSPLDTIEEHLEVKVHARLGSPVMQSMTWMLNTACINAATTIMFDLYAARADEDKPRTLVEYAGSIAENLDRDEVYAGTKDDNRECEIESNENTLAMLLGIRQSWYDLTKKYMAAADMSDNAQSAWADKHKFSAMLVKGDNREVNSEEMALIKFDMTQLTTDPEELAQLIADKVKTVATVKEQSAAEKLKLAPVKLEILRTVGKHMKHEARFDQLPLRTQAMLTKFALTAINRPLDDLRTRMARRESLAYTHLSLAAIRAKRELEYVIKSKYNEVSELENTTSGVSHEKLDQARNEKSFACTID